MKRTSIILAAAVAAFVLVCQSANAQSLFNQKGDPRLQAVSLGVGAGATVGLLALNKWRFLHWESSVLSEGGAYALTTVGCMAAAPIIGTIVVNRPLTMREGHVMFASCLIPIVGGWIVNAAYDAHPEWEAGSAPEPTMRHHHKHHAKKM